MTLRLSLLKLATSFLTDSLGRAGLALASLSPMVLADLTLSSLDRP